MGQAHPLVAELQLPEQQDVDVDRPRPVAEPAALGGPARASSPLTASSSASGSSAVSIQHARVQEARLIEHLADRVGVVGRGALQRVTPIAPATVDGRLQVRPPLADVRAETEQSDASRHRRGHAARRLQPRRLDLLAHRLSEGQQPGDRAQHHGEVDDQTVIVEAQQVDALDLPAGDRRPEDQRVRRRPISSSSV